MKTKLRIIRSHSVCRDNRQWYWIIEIQNGHTYALGCRKTRIGCMFDFVINGIPWLLRAWRL